MKKLLVLLLLVILFLTACRSVTRRSDTLSDIEELPKLEEGTTERDLIILYVDESPDNFKKLDLTTKDVEAGEHLADRMDLIRVKSGIDVDSMIKRIEENDNVQSVSKDTVIQLDDPVSFTVL